MESKAVVVAYVKSEIKGSLWRSQRLVGFLWFVTLPIGRVFQVRDQQTILGNFTHLPHLWGGEGLAQA